MNGNGHYIPAEPINHRDDDDDDGGAAKDHSRKKRKRRRIGSHRWWWILMRQYWHRGSTASRVVVALVIASLCMALLFILSLNVANDDFTNTRNRWRRRAAERLATIEASQKQRQQKQKSWNQHNTDERGDGDGWKRLMKKAEQDKMFNGKRRRYRFTDPRHLPPLDDAYNPLFDEKRFLHGGIKENQFLRVKRHHKTVGRPFFFKRLGRDDGKEDSTMEWVKHADEILADSNGPKVDYTKHKYAYPTLMTDGPPTDGTYPPLEPLRHSIRRWPQDSIDEPPAPFVEQLQHFDFSDPKQRRAAEAFRNAELPFKVYNVPELELATEKWTDEYVSAQFDTGKRNDAGSFFFRGIFGGGGGGSSNGGGNGDETASSSPPPARAHGRCQESDNNFFEFFTPETWDVSAMGLPPTRDNDFTYEVWSKHARYADAIGLQPNEIHYYWQSGVPREERYQSHDTWTFVSRDLPSFSSVEPNFFCTSPDKQKGIQCRFGERGVTAATHYDGGKNMVAMVTGAKRYVLSPPKACSKLGIVTTRGHPIFRHSNLNFGHLNLLPSESLLTNGESDGGKQEEEEDEDDEVKQFMSSEEREWLKRASGAMAVETVLKAGEVLYIPSHWFHYITSLQKSAQCNVRSGKDLIGTKEFGGFDDVDKCDGG